MTPMAAVKTFVWAGRSGFFVSLYDERQGMDDDLHPRAELWRSSPYKSLQQAGRREYALRSTIQRAPRLIRRLICEEPS